MNAQLELRFELIRAITPKYSEYKYIKSPVFETRTADDTPVTKALKKTSKTAHKWTRIDVDAVARSGGIERADAVKKLQEWNDSGVIELQPSGVVNRFRVLKDFPQGEEAKSQIITSIYAQIEAREKSDMERVQRVIDLVTTQGCLSRELARHFADDGTVPQGGCRHCNFCLTKTPVQFIQAHNQSRKGRIDEAKLKAILAATNVRDDPRFLARVAFGISSPRVTAEKLGKHAVFGCMDDCDFEVSEQGLPSLLQLGGPKLMIPGCSQELVGRFDKVCES